MRHLVLLSKDFFKIKEVEKKACNIKIKLAPSTKHIRWTIHIMVDDKRTLTLKHMRREQKEATIPI